MSNEMERFKGGVAVVNRASYLSRLDAPALSEELAATLGVVSERRRPG